MSEVIVFNFEHWFCDTNVNVKNWLGHVVTTTCASTVYLSSPKSVDQKANHKFQVKNPTYYPLDHNALTRVALPNA